MEEFAPGITVSLGAGAFGPADIHVISPRRNRGRGINLAWGQCEPGSNRLVFLETVQITNTGCTNSELRLITTGHDLASNQGFQCPLAVLCDAPLYTKVCLGNVFGCFYNDGRYSYPALCSQSGEAVINAATNSQSPCRVTAVQPNTWSGVKSLYRG